jgi:MFS family permease
VASPAFSALVPEMVSRDALPKATAINQTAGSVAMLLAPALGGILFGRFGLRVPLLIDAASCLAVTAVVLVIRIRRGAGREPAAGAAASGAVGWSVWCDRVLRATMIIMGTVVAALSAVNVADVFFVRTTLGGSATVYGLLGAVWTGAMLIGAWLVGRRTVDEAWLGRALLGSLAGAGAAVLLAATVSGIVWLVPLWVVGGVGNGAVNVVSGVLVARRAPAVVRGRAFAVYGAVCNGANTVGYLIGGVLMNVLSARVLIGLAGAVGLAVALAFAVPLLRARAGGDPAPAHPAQRPTTVLPAGEPL